MLLLIFLSNLPEQRHIMPLKLEVLLSDLTIELINSFRRRLIFCLDLCQLFLPLFDDLAVFFSVFVAISFR